MKNFLWEKIINLISIITFRTIPKKLIEFGMVGFFGIIIQLIFFYIFNSFNNNFLSNNLIALLIGTISGYCLNNFITFKNKELKGKKFILGMFKFLIFSFITITINICVSLLVFNLLKVKIIAIFSGIICGFLSNYFISRKLVWKV